MNEQAYFDNLWLNSFIACSENFKFQLLTTSLFFSFNRLCLLLIHSINQWFLIEINYLLIAHSNQKNLFWRNRFVLLFEGKKLVKWRYRIKISWSNILLHFILYFFIVHTSWKKIYKKTEGGRNVSKEKYFTHYIATFDPSVSYVFLLSSFSTFFISHSLSFYRQ